MLRRVLYSEKSALYKSTLKIHFIYFLQIILVFHHAVEIDVCHLNCLKEM